MYVASFAERARGAYFRHISSFVGLLPVPEEMAAALRGEEDAASIAALERLCELSQALHQIPAPPQRQQMEQEVDTLVASLYGLDAADMAALRDYFAFIRAKGPPPVSEGASL